MPITPFHLGPGVVLKPVFGERFSLTVFAIAQALMDAEVIARAVLDSDILHGYANTLLGATVVGVLAATGGKPLAERLLRWWNRRLTERQAAWARAPTSISCRSAWAGALWGVYSHWALDAMMHADALPFAPFSHARPLLGVLTIEALHSLCIATMLVGLAGLVVARMIRRRRALV